MGSSLFLVLALLGFSLPPVLSSGSQHGTGSSGDQASKHSLQEQTQALLALWSSSAKHGAGKSSPTSLYGVPSSTLCRAALGGSWGLRSQAG